MIIENLNGIFCVYAEGTNKLTDKERSFFSNKVYIKSEKEIINYEEVPYDIWKCYIKDQDVENVILKEKIKKIEGNLESNENSINNNSNLILENSKSIEECNTNILMNQDMILDTMMAVSDSYENQLILEDESSNNTELNMQSMEALVDVYELVLSLQERIDSLENLVTNIIDFNNLKVENTDIPENTDVPEIGDTNVPEDNDVPETENTDIPENTDISENADISETENTDVPEIGNTDIPENTDVPETENTDIPKNTDIPENTEVPEIGDVDIPEDTDVPETEDISSNDKEV